MTLPISKEELATLAALVDQRRTALNAEISAELEASENEHYQRLAGEVHDRGEEAFADLLIDVDNAVVQLHLDSDGKQGRKRVHVDNSSEPSKHRISSSQARTKQKTIN